MAITLLGDLRKLRDYAQCAEYLDNAGIFPIKEDSDDSRDYYIIPEVGLLKLALGHTGRKSNRKEVQTLTSFLGSKKADYFPRILDHVANYSWILVEPTMPIKNDREFRNKTGIPLGRIEDGIQFLSPKIQGLKNTNSVYKRLKHIHNSLSKESQWYAGLIDLVVSEGMPMDKVISSRSWGIIARGKKRVVLLNPVELLSFAKRNGIFTT